ncbi:MAG: MarR family winged helix-turn-helix transcriptional regulator [Steroidobacteraceae bacterium]
MSPSASESAAERSGGRELSLTDYQLLAEFRHVLARFLAFSATAATAAGLAPRQHQALLAIKGAPGAAPMTVGDLAARLVIRHHSAVELVDRMVSSGYLRRRADPGDRRRAILVLTANAERALAGLSAAHRDELRRIAPLLSTLVNQLGAAP